MKDLVYKMGLSVDIICFYEKKYLLEFFFCGENNYCYY